MNIHEYQAKALLSKFGVKVLEGYPAFTVEEAVSSAKKINGNVWVVKSQIHAGGRGKGGGVKVVKSIEDVQSEAKRMLGMNLVTHQTGPSGKEVKRLYIESGCAIAKEFYLAMLIDRETSKIVIMASTEGGMDIEEVAEKNPSAIIKVQVDIGNGIQDWHCRHIAFSLKLSGEQVGQLAKLLKGMFNAFVGFDASLIEINPLVISQSGEVIALDAKMSFDDNALFKHPELMELRDLNEEDPKETEASDHALNYIRLDGNIGCMVNGAGLAMSTMDIINYYGGSPANFLDVGGGATKEKVKTAFSIILNDKNVKGILVNIFGGIMRCDIIAEGIVAAAKELDLTIPVVVRLEGTNVNEGKAILNSSGLAVISADGLDDAARKIVTQVNGKLK